MRWGLVFIWPALVWPLPAMAQPPPRDLSIEEAVRLALTSRAELDAAAYSIEAREAATRQAARTLNPTLSIQSENWRFSEDFSIRSDLDFFVYASQQIETGGKRRSRTAAAESDREAAQAERAVLRWRVTNVVREAWWRAAAAAEQARLREGSLQNAAELARYHEALLSEGAAAEVDLLRVRVELERRRSEAAAAQTQAEQAALTLLKEMATPSSGPIAFSRRPDVRTTPPAAELISQALSARPDLALERALVSQARAAVDVQRSGAQPDVTPYLGYKRTGFFDTLIGGVSIPLPVRNRNVDGIEEALADLKSQEALARASEMRVRAEVEAAAADVARRRAMLDSFQGGVVDQAIETHEIAQAAYREDAVDLLFVLDSLKTRQEVELLFSQALYDYQISRERLLAATAQSAVGEF